MMLGRQDLIRTWKNKAIRFAPDISESQINLSSIDLRLGFNFTRLKAQRAVVIRPAHDFDPTDLTENEDLSSTRDPLLRLQPSEFVLAQTLESIALPNNLAAHIHGKSSLARSGVTIHATAPHIHPGFEGHITLELFNCGPWELQFTPGKDLVCQVMFWELKTAPSRKAIEALSTYRMQKFPFPKRNK
jgi:dCTP deaminase